MFIRGKIYRHIAANSSLDIKVLSVDHINAKRAKLKVQYVLKLTRRVQYTGKGARGHTDRIVVKSDQWKYWKPVKA